MRVVYRNCGGLGQEGCDDETCKDDLLPVNLGGLSTICRKPEEARASGGIVGGAGTADTTGTEEEEVDTEVPAETEVDTEAPAETEDQYALTLRLHERLQYSCCSFGNLEQLSDLLRVHVSK